MIFLFSFEYPPTASTIVPEEEKRWLSSSLISFAHVVTIIAHLLESKPSTTKSITLEPTKYVIIEYKGRIQDPDTIPHMIYKMTL